MTRLIVEDAFPPIAWPREKFLEWLAPERQVVTDRGDRLPPGHLGALGRSLRYLLSCPWCMSVWVGAGVAYVFTLYVSVPLPVAVWIVSSAVTGLIAAVEDKLST